LAARRDDRPDANELKRIAATYTAFAVDEARGWSGIYERLALAVARLEQLLAFIASLPAERRQPNLFLGAVRHVCGVPADGDDLARSVAREHARIRETMLSRTTQTNEPGRCAVLLPVLARLPQPLALLEVGASAGLCLLPDRYGYDYSGTRIEPAMTSGDVPPPVFACDVTGSLPVPSAVPRVIWRRGLDLNPLDLTSASDTGWLETLVWPEQDVRAQRLRAAIAIARRDPPPVVRGDLLTDLEPLLAAAPRQATLVVFHTAVLAYVASRPARDRFAAMMRDANVVWISNEHPGVFPTLATSAPASRQRRFLLMVNGKPLAWTGPHGQSIDWFG
jgi:hypothetical protein